MMAMKDWRDQRGTNLFDGGAPFCAVYETSDRRYMAVGAVEAKFYARLLDALGIEADVERQHDRESRPVLEKQFADTFRTRTQAEWTDLFEDRDACVAPVLGLREAVKHPHIQARGTIVSHRGMLQSAPAPRFSVAQTRLADGPPRPGQHTREVLTDRGVPGVKALIDSDAARESR
jgi:alpha-methylacyl-CoA racemase